MYVPVPVQVYIYIIYRYQKEEKIVEKGEERAAVQMKNLRFVMSSHRIKKI